MAVPTICGVCQLHPVTGYAAGVILGAETLSFMTENHQHLG